MPGFARTPFDNWMDQLARSTGGQWFYARLAGAGHSNPDGSSRQGELATLNPMDELQLEEDPDNAFDPNAVRVLSPAGNQVGFLEARLAGETVRRRKRGTQTRCFVSNLTGRTGQSLGLVMGVLTAPQ